MNQLAKISPYVFPLLQCNYNYIVLAKQKAENHNVKSMDKLEEVICSEFQMLPKELRLHSKSRKREIVLPRQVFFYFARRIFTHFSLHKIGDYYNKDHATVSNSIYKIRDLIGTDKNFAEKINKIKQLI